MKKLILLSLLIGNVFAQTADYNFPPSKAFPGQDIMGNPINGFGQMPNGINGVPTPGSKKVSPGLNDDMGKPTSSNLKFNMPDGQHKESAKAHSVVKFTEDEKGLFRIANSHRKKLFKDHKENELNKYYKNKAGGNKIPTSLNETWVKQEIDLRMTLVMMKKDDKERKKLLIELIEKQKKLATISYPEIQKNLSDYKECTGLNLESDSTARKSLFIHSENELEDEMKFTEEQSNPEVKELVRRYVTMMYIQYSTYNDAFTTRRMAKNCQHGISTKGQEFLENGSRNLNMKDSPLDPVDNGTAPDDSSIQKDG